MSPAGLQAAVRKWFCRRDAALKTARAAGCSLPTARLPRGTEAVRYRCFLPDLTEFAGPTCTGPDCQQSTSSRQPCRLGREPVFNRFRGSNQQPMPVPDRHGKYLELRDLYPSSGETGQHTIGERLRPRGMGEAAVSSTASRCYSRPPVRNLPFQGLSQHSRTNRHTLRRLPQSPDSPTAASSPHAHTTTSVPRTKVL